MVNDLDQYLFLSGTSSQAFAKSMGVSRATVDNLRYGKRSVNGYKEHVTAAIEKRNQELQIALGIGDKIVSKTIVSRR